MTNQLKILTLLLLRFTVYREHYYAETEGIIFVIDCADTVRLCVVLDELNSILTHKGKLRWLRKRADYRM